MLLLFLSSAKSHGPSSLKTVFQKDFLIGVAVNRAQIQGLNSSETDLIATQFNSLTAENDMKWMYIHPESDRFDFSVSDKLVAFATEHNMEIIGHTLIWHSQVAPWVFQENEARKLEKQELFDVMQDHVITIVDHYNGRIQRWEVVNETLNEDGTLRNSNFLKIGGEDYLNKAFQFAHKANPEAALNYNDYNLINAAKRDGAIRLIQNIQQARIPIYGVGIQAHWDLEHPTINDIEEAIQLFSETGVKVMFTELDISVLPSPWDIPTADIDTNFKNSEELNPYPDQLPDAIRDKLAKRYAEIFELFKKHSDKIDRVTFWGLHDGRSWKNNFPIRGRTDYPLLFDRKL